MKKTLLVATAIITAGCSSTPAPPFDWRTFVVPVENGEFITDVQSAEKNYANEIALKAIYGACDGQRPVILSRETIRKGLMSETFADVYKVAAKAAYMLGNWSPNINDEEYSAEWRFRCESIGATSEAERSQDQSQIL